jgi:hypothetical protein
MLSRTLEKKNHTKNVYITLKYLKWLIVFVAMSFEYKLKKKKG